jgi:hypothetical protein
MADKTILSSSGGGGSSSNMGLTPDGVSAVGNGDGSGSSPAGNGTSRDTAAGVQEAQAAASPAKALPGKQT